MNAASSLIATILPFVALVPPSRAQEQNQPPDAQASHVITVAEAARLTGSRDRVTVRPTLMAETAPGFFFMRDETGPVRGRLETPIEMHAGDLLEVTGMPVFTRGAAWLDSATARVIGRGSFPEPLRLDAKECYSSPEARARHDAAYVTVRGIITSRSIHRDNYRIRGAWTIVSFYVFEVDQDGTRIRVFFHMEDKPWDHFSVGMEAEFTGTCRLDAKMPDDGEGQVHVILPGLQYVKVLKLPPFWERPDVQRGMRLAMLGITAFFALAVAWAFGQFFRLKSLRASEEKYRNLSLSLERRVAERTSELAAALAQQTELARLKTDFVSLVSHEFRTPLGVIMSAVDVLRRYFDRLPPEKRQRHLDMIFNSTRNLAVLIEEVLLLGRVEDGREQFSPAPHDLDKLCRVLTDEHISATAGECPIDYRSCGDLTSAMLDEALLRHIIHNLLSNAVKYSEPGRHVEFSVTRDGRDAIFTVRDHGIGIPPEDQARVFSSFTRAGNVGTRPGTGLGLVIVQRCVQLHGGVIRLDSAPGDGTTMTVTLPVFPTPSPSTPPPP